ncbi:CgeB family protein [Novosphingobium huizhouense]|uniref:CgeB family protein n=1 Tax=Novosphingobium huizhouense TaxID=2866625 RepID=UPI001CD8952F|nr:glycosyltransferase [Novosphingobium huizhouense]
MARSRLRIALVADELTRACLSHECTVLDVAGDDFSALSGAARPDLLLVESAWHGIGGSWKGRIARYPAWMLRSNRRLRALVAKARDLGIPAAFWNKEDGVHFPRFIDSARLFDHVFTVDANCLPRYRAEMGVQARLDVLPFPVQPAFHAFTGFHFERNDANFVGSYSSHVHDARRAWQDMAFRAVLDAGMGLVVYDRNSNRQRQVYRYPDLPGLEVRAAVDHAATAQIYKTNLVSLNVNTVTDSETMFSRRLVEILACGGIAVTSPARSVDASFRDFCHVVSCDEEARALFARLRHGPSAEDLDRAREGARHVLANHTWAQRLDQLAAALGC